jgi:membrane peptidoglycan carboxypeptidase
VTNSEGPGKTTDSLYTGTVQSINVFFAHLEQQVGLCNVVKTAVNLGVTRFDGSSLLTRDVTKIGGQKVTLDPADALPTFTLGVVNVSPMSMAAAYATPAANGVYCKPIALLRIIDNTGKSLPVPSAGCHQAIPVRVAQAVNYILQGVFTANGATAAGQGLANHPAAGKTGTSNVENGPGTPYAAFGGYTTALAGYVSVFNPVSPTVKDTMYNTSACYRSWYGYQECPGEMFGANAPLSAWHLTFDHANLSGSVAFQPVPPDSALWQAGDGQTVKLPKCGKGDKPSTDPNNPPQCTPADGNGGNGNGDNGGGQGTPPTFLPIAPPSP